MDYPDDPRTWTVDNQYMAGESLLVAPVLAGRRERNVYLPEGIWFDFWSHRRFAGKQAIRIESPISRIPVFVKSGTLLPLATATLHAADPGAFRIAVRVYGDGNVPAVLYEDDGSARPEFARLTLHWDAAGQTGTADRVGPKQSRGYQIEAWEAIPGLPA